MSERVKERAVTAPSIDGHCHAWERWPYDAAARDSLVRGDGETLGNLMDEHGVSRAVVVSAGIGQANTRTDNSKNNAYVARLVAGNDRFSQLVDFDSFWQKTHHTVGAPDRLRALLDAYSPIGASHYVKGDDDGWFESKEGDQTLELLSDAQMLFSVHLGPEWFGALEAIARRHEGLRFLIHHQAMLSPGRADAAAELKRFRDLATLPNIYVKASGFHYLSQQPWNYPHTDTHGVFRSIVDSYGPQRLVWGSDFPAGGRYITYKQSIELIRTQFADLGDAALADIYGGTMFRLLNGES